MELPVCRAGLAVPFDEDEALRRFEAPEIVISVDLGAGSCATTVWTCDLTHDYISINARLSLVALPAMTLGTVPNVMTYGTGVANEQFRIAFFGGMVMKYARDLAPSLTNEQLGRQLYETLPWVKNITGKTVVIKYGGAAMVDADLREKVMGDILLLKIIGARVVIVHGGGAAINEAHQPLRPARGIQGRPAGDDARDHGDRAPGARGQGEPGTRRGAQQTRCRGRGRLRAATAARSLPSSSIPSSAAWARSVRCNTDYLETLLDNDYIPVVATVAQGTDGGFFNVNADLAAGHIAAAIHAHKAIFLTDVDGLYEDFSDKTSLISNLTLERDRADDRGGRGFARA